MVVLAGWALFYYTDMGRLWGFVKAGLFMNGAVDVLARSVLTGRLFLIVICFIACTPLPKRAGQYLTKGNLKYAVPVFNAVMLGTSFMLVLAQTFNPFLYFNF
jgi:hypothetical protein